MKLNKKIFQQILDDYYTTHDLKFVLAVDFDDTLCYSNYPKCGEPTPITKFIQSVRGLNFALILTTCRTGTPLYEALKWLKTQGIEPDYVNCNCVDRIDAFGDTRKIGCDLLLDDKTWGFNMSDFD